MTTICLENISKNFKKDQVLSDVNFSVEEGEIVAILGPSGCGKTTTLRIVAGFEKQTNGTLYLKDTAITNKQNWIPVNKRGVGMVFQDYALFPHLTVEQNVRFGIGKQKHVNCETLISTLLELVELTGMEKRYPHELSGGQKQRVALARALAPSPHVLLMDEPFSNLDAELKYTMRFEVQRILKKANISTIFVTHDQKDALAIADKIIVMNEGKVEQVGTPDEVYNTPQTPFVARFISRANLIKAEKKGNVIFSELGKMSVSKATETGTGHLMIRRDAIFLSSNGTFEGKVKYLAFEGEYKEVTLRIGKQDIAFFTANPQDQVPDVGEKVKFSIRDYYFLPDAQEEVKEIAN